MTVFVLFACWRLHAEEGRLLFVAFDERNSLMTCSVCLESTPIFSDISSPMKVLHYCQCCAVVASWHPTCRCILGGGSVSDVAVRPSPGGIAGSSLSFMGVSVVSHHCVQSPNSSVDISVSSWFNPFPAFPCTSFLVPKSTECYRDVNLIPLPALLMKFPAFFPENAQRGCSVGQKHSFSEFCPTGEMHEKLKFK